MRKINQHKTTYHKEIAALITLIFFFFIWYCFEKMQDNITYVRVDEPSVIIVQDNKVEIITDSYIKERIKHYFPRSHKTMIPIAYAESGLNHEAQNWNCYYNKDKSIVYTSKVRGSHSTFCKKEHRKYAWSVDCGVLQKHYKGLKQCPKIGLDEHLEEVAELSRVQGLNAWVAYQNGSYKKFVNK